MRTAVTWVVLVGVVGLTLAFTWRRVTKADDVLGMPLSKPGNVIVADAKPENLKKATFAGGCFWGVEEMFRHVKGVTATEVGYAGGTTAKPTYSLVSSGATGHAECVQVTYDATKVTYAELLDAFWSCHDPTQLNRQGPDWGTQYRTAIFFQDAEQEKIARASLKEVSDAKLFDDKIVTEIKPVGVFTPAEEYHQQYLAKNGGVCHTGPVKVTTKLAKEAAAALAAASVPATAPAAK